MSDCVASLLKQICQTALIGLVQVDELLVFILISQHVLLWKGGEKVLLHFIQDSPGDHIALEDISKALGISATVTEGQRPVVRHPMIMKCCYDSHLSPLFSLSAFFNL